MPGVPFEMTEMAETKVFPLLKEKFKLPTILHKTISTFGMPESFLAETIQPWEEKLPETIKLAYLPSPERVRLRMSVESSGSKITEKTLNNEIDKLKKIIGQTIFATEDELLENTIGKLLKEKAQTLATAESCTGGNIAKLITSVSGCSDYYEGSVIAYSNRIKTKILGVKTETLEKFGAVSKETVEEMALGVMKLYDSDFAIAVSGIAGPNGGTENKPVGTTWIAVASKNNIISKNFSFGTKRELNIRRASSKALDMLRLMLLK